MTYAPLVLEGLEQESIINRFGRTFIFGLTNSIMYLSMEKPFNPILGETFQCWINGSPGYAEQISHHPPIAALLLQGRGYRVTGNYCISQLSWSPKSAWASTQAPASMTASTKLNSTTALKSPSRAQEARSKVSRTATEGSTYLENVQLLRLSLLLDSRQKYRNGNNLRSLQEGRILFRQARKTFRLLRRHDLGGPTRIHD
jgi:hypothetical protein